MKLLILYLLLIKGGGIVSVPGDDVSQEDGSGDLNDLELSGDNFLVYDSTVSDSQDSSFLNDEDEIITLSDNDKGRSNLVIQPEKLIGPQYFVSRPGKKDIDKALSSAIISTTMIFPDKILDLAAEKRISCECECLDKYQYKHTDSKVDENVDFVFESGHVQDKCDETQEERCCGSEPGQPRFRFPGQKTKIPENHPTTDNSISGTEVISSLLNTDKFSTVHFHNQTEKLGTNLGSQTSWFLILDLEKSTKLELKLSARSKMSLLGRMNKKPQLKKFKFLEVLDGFTMDPLELFVKEGTWYFKITNEEPFDQEILLTISKQTNESDEAPACCDSNTRRIFGNLMKLDQEHRCQQGVYVGERGCLCSEGWFGTTCNISSEDCSKSFCHGNGECSTSENDLGMVSVMCQCEDGFSGDQCDQLSCSDDCGHHGVCQGGQCRCLQGWDGPGCNMTKSVETEIVCMESLIAEQGN